MKCEVCARVQPQFNSNPRSLYDVCRSGCGEVRGGVLPDESPPPPLTCLPPQAVVQACELAETKTEALMGKPKRRPDL